MNIWWHSWLELSLSKKKCAKLKTSKIIREQNPQTSSFGGGWQIWLEAVLYTRCYLKNGSIYDLALNDFGTIQCCIKNNVSAILKFTFFKEYSMAKWKISFSLVSDLYYHITTFYACIKNIFKMLAFETWNYL